MPEQHVRRRQHRHPGGQLLGHALRRPARRAAPRTPSSSRPVSSVGQLRPSPAARRPRRSRRCASAVQRRPAVVDQPARGPLDQGAHLEPHPGLHARRRACCRSDVDLARAAAASRRSRGPRSWPGSARPAVAPVSPASRWQKVMPAPLTRSLTTWVTMISRRSGWSSICAAVALRASASGSSRAGRCAGTGRRAGRWRAARRPARSWCRPAAPRARARSGPRRARAGRATSRAVGRTSSSRSSSPVPLEPAHPVLVHVQQRRRLRDGVGEREVLLVVVAQHQRRPTSSVIDGEQRRCAASRSGRRRATTRSSRILMLTSWSEVSTPAELSMKSVLIRPPRRGVLDPAELGEAEVAALADAPGAQLARRRPGSRRWPCRRRRRWSRSAALT